MISARAKNEDGTFPAAPSTFSVTVKDVAPIVMISGSATVNEGGLYTLSLSANDQGADNIISWTINWDD